ncbi:uncharacterized protein LOC120349844 [Nilaparvata lugens]|uniref:uncharacterized protein LOC120349844 n=1 Tax=Nilaparvata lugens TaxID=108931 RepID=UPI00193E283C|nr:uncharacterized protein LOC120349844 [Nilaparvata lugens]
MSMELCFGLSWNSTSPHCGQIIIIFTQRCLRWIGDAGHRRFGLSLRLVDGVLRLLSVFGGIRIGSNMDMQGIEGATCGGEVVGTSWSSSWVDECWPRLLVLKPMEDMLPGSRLLGVSASSSTGVGVLDGASSTIAVSACALGPEGSATGYETSELGLESSMVKWQILG